jgi:uncharacterized protein
MTVKDELKAALTVAMKARDERALSSLRQALSAIAVEVRKHHEAADAFETAGRAEKTVSERAEAAVLEAYLPAALSDDELAQLVTDEIAAAAADGATGMKAMGRVVSAVRAKAGTSADGAKIAAKVKAALAG